MAYKKGNWKPKTKEQKQKELDDLIKASNSKIEQYQSNPEDMIEFAKFMSKIHNYSPLNLSLIDEGFEGAIAVASYDGWKKLGFQVKAKEKGIGIYAHAPVTVFIDENGEEKTLKEATN
ncbi:ArdC-like ssDNA-binding domain-containing protein, partial [Enterococcus faecium]